MSTRTTLTLEDDVAQRLEAEVRRTGKSLKHVVNDLLRRALAVRRRPETRPFVVKARALGLRAGLSYDSIGDLLESVEGPGHR
ncbi:MAG TPA: hypothetical protein VMT17_06000 [Anaeromyxobacteraceae bacterium]|nr:hypothetical protein [Anaeromyxobacteraceae bacterium]